MVWPTLGSRTAKERHRTMTIERYQRMRVTSQQALVRSVGSPESATLPQKWVKVNLRRLSPRCRAIILLLFEYFPVSKC